MLTQDRARARGAAGSPSAKFMSDLADVFRAGHSQTNASTHVRGTRQLGRAGPEAGPGLGQIGPSLIAPPKYHTIAVRWSSPRWTPTFGRPRAVALVDRWCVFLIDPYPGSPPTLTASVDRFRRVDHTIPGYSSVGDEAVNDPNRPLTREGLSRRVRRALVRLSDEPVPFTSNASTGPPLKWPARLRQGVSVGLSWVVWTVWSGSPPTPRTIFAACDGVTAEMPAASTLADPPEWPELRPSNTRAQWSPPARGGNEWRRVASERGTYRDGLPGRAVAPVPAVTLQRHDFRGV
jgi:hypothetical protein